MTTPAVPSSSMSSSMSSPSPSATRSDFSGWDDDVGSDVNSEAEYGLDPRVARAEPDDNSDRKGTNRQVGGAAVAAGVAGALLMGPVLGLAAAGGAAVLAARNKGPAGNVARASGEAVSNTGERLRKFDQKHHVTATASKGLAKSAKWVADKTKIKNKNGGAPSENLTA